VVVALAACSRAPDSAVQRTAFLPFANLTGDTSLDWIASEAPAIIASQIASSATLVPLRVETLSDAYRARATRLVHGYFTKRGDVLRFEVDVEDAARHHMVKNTLADGSVLDAMNSVAKSLDPAAQAFSTSNSGAVAAWGRHDYEQAVMLDPDFGAAWVAWMQTLADQGNATGAIEVARRALERPSLRNALDRAQIEVASATLRQDSSGRSKALTTLTRLEPADTSVIDALAQNELNARHFANAIEQYRKLLLLDPANSAAMNTLGYAEAYTGDVDAARKALEEYGRQPDQKLNSLDSIGEAYFMNGRFADAEKFFLQAYQADQTFLGGAELNKAAYARWLGGDLTGADAIMQQQLSRQASLHDPLVTWREAVWEYATGRREQAMVKLASAPAASKEVAERQMAVWRGAVKVTRDLSALKQLYERTPPTADSQVRTFYASALVAAGKEEEARPLLALWPMPDSGGDPLLQSLVYPMFLEARRAVGLN
jgi:Flp pilus assembly protein TadD